MVDITFQFEAFSFNGICKTVALPLCPLMGKDEGIEPECYSRNVDLGGNLIFQPGMYAPNSYTAAAFMLGLLH